MKNNENSVTYNTFGKGSEKRAINGGNDAYYTNSEYATHCCDIIRSKFYRYKIDTIVEPSAGNSSFAEGIDLLCKQGNKKSVFMYDIDPQSENIIKKDFFEVELNDKTLVVGNPPFGFAARMAIKFFNHAANQRAKLIAFILPRTFKKDSVKNKLNLHYHLIYEEDCPKNVFLLDDIPYDVPCVFQVWAHSTKKRVVDYWHVNNKWFEYTTPTRADFCIRRVGARSGQILNGSPTMYSEVSTYFCKEKVKGVKKILQNIDFSEIVNSTAGVRSLSKREIHKALYNYYNMEDLK
jgi:hypothetical protein